MGTLNGFARSQMRVTKFTAGPRLTTHDHSATIADLIRLVPHASGLFEDSTFSLSLLSRMLTNRGSIERKWRRRSLHQTNGEGAASKAVIPDVRVLAQDKVADLRRETITNRAGDYVFAYPIGGRQRNSQQQLRPDRLYTRRTHPTGR
ncbi:MAG: hypothetical protein JOZ22_18260 [Acidobacteriia bacterium]|nr:hypothetical protein [Terriglobia bacterium]